MTMALNIYILYEKMICYTYINTYVYIEVVYWHVCFIKRESNIFPRIYSKYPSIIYYMINIGKMDF